MKDQEILKLSAQHGTLNDFGKTFFTDDELIEFVREILGKKELIKSQVN